MYRTIYFKKTWKVVVLFGVLIPFLKYDTKQIHLYHCNSIGRNPR